MMLWAPDGVLVDSLNDLAFCAGRSSLISNATSATSLIHNAILCDCISAVV